MTRTWPSRASAACAHHALGRCARGRLHDHERLGDLQCIAQPALHFPPRSHARRLVGRRYRLAHQRHVAAVRGRRGLSDLWLRLRDISAATCGRPVPAPCWDDLADALRFRLHHRLGHYNAVQRLLYSGVIVVICMSVLTGLSIWKPVQLGWLTGLFGGYPIARGIHLAMMFCILAFVAVHLALVALFPRTLGFNARAEPRRGRGVAAMNHPIVSADEVRPELKRIGRRGLLRSGLSLGGLDAADGLRPFHA